MAPKPPKTKRGSRDSKEQPPIVHCQEHPIDDIDKEQSTSVSKSDMDTQLDSNYRDGETSCNDCAHDTGNHPWHTCPENDPDIVSSHRREVNR
jgi:hypothetical protein